MTRKPWALMKWRQRREEILKKRNRCEWCGKSKLEVPLTMDHITKPNQLTKDNYVSLRDEDIVVLCKRCSYARLKGKILCKKCKEHYHSPRYSQCYHCNDIIKKPMILINGMWVEKSIADEDYSAMKEIDQIRQKELLDYFELLPKI